MKAVSALHGPFDAIRTPRASKKLDYEAELVIVIGRKAQYVSEAEALDYVAGFAVGHDVSEREFQRERVGQFVKGKSADTFAPIGPWLVTLDAVADIQKLKIWSKVNGEIRQNSNTENMIFGAAKIVSYVSQFMTLEPGDAIFTGTPAGVGAGMTPPTYLRAEGVVEIGIEGLGVQQQIVLPAFDHK
ncbi:MAG: 2-keto-4-pentenoate hydratase/2-oxohepta-3-ene-1,7-dioic acid hydratase in catechol pathway [Candidatus Azotimanducaceae bacterium]|jgi:2-keto-4-pentenoate hydratase/2-oxohepta-3-ene-1,7-dioic acid hydratase in catechol pathway